MNTNQRMLKITYEFIDGEVLELHNGEVHNAWSIFTVPDSILRRVVAWNDKDGDFDECERLALLQIFLADFVVTRA